MSNAELYSGITEFETRIALESFLKYHNINYTPNMEIEELRQLYIDYETIN